MERRGLHRILESEGVYRTVQRLFGSGLVAASRWGDLYPELQRAGTRVLDIGCGPAALYARLHPVSAPFEYVGIEPNCSYVERARQRFPSIELHCGTVDEVRGRVKGSFGLIVLEGVLHHIDDGVALEALRFARERLAAGGRVVTLDVALVAQQHPIARALARLDRGQNVRTLAGYRNLVGEVFGMDRTEVRHLSGRLRVPYDHALVQAR